MEEILREILQELKWQSKQNEKIMDLLGKLRQPCGGNRANPADVSAMMNLLKGVAGMSKNPEMAKFVEQAEETIKKAGN